MSGRSQKPPSQRQLRVGEELRHVLAAILERGELRDPDLADVSTTVTEVRISPDLRNATVFVMPLGSSATETVLSALNRARPFLRRLMAKSVKLKYAPNIRFEADPSFEQAAHIDALLKDPRVARDLASNENWDNDGEDQTHGT